MKRSIGNFAALLAAVCLVTGIGCSKKDTTGGKSATGVLQITGAGATFPYPIYSKWFFEYQKSHPNMQFNYQSIGSGGGIQQITARTVDFGASDAPMTDEQLAKLDSPLLHIPTVMGAVAVVYNLPGVASGLKLNSAVLADILMGKIAKWNDPQIAALNPGQALPAQDIAVIYRSDGSGTTHVFTEYLAKVSPSWKEKVGAGKSVNWPVGIGGKGNEGVAGLVKQTPGAIGYAELTYALENQLAYVWLQNKAGKFVEPTLASISAAAAGMVSKIPADYRTSLTDADGAESYPISALTYLLIYKQQTDEAKGKALVDFLRWALSNGQQLASALHYAPLPTELIAKVNTTVNEMTVMKK